MDKTEQEARHVRDMALARAVKMAIPGTPHKEIVDAAEAFAEFLGGPPAPTVWFMSRPPEEMTALLGTYMRDRPERARDIAYYLLREWLHGPEGGAADV